MPRTTIKAHLRYPQDLFRYQTDVVPQVPHDQPDDLLQRPTCWEVSPDPGSGEVAGADDHDVQTPTTTNAPQNASSSGKRIEPLYVLMRAAGSDRGAVPHPPTVRPGLEGQHAQNLVVVHGREVRSRTQYGKLESFTMPTGSNTVVGPGAGEQHDPQHRRDLARSSRC